MDPYQDLAAANPEALTADGFEDAFVGFTSGYFSPAVAVYDYEKCAQVLMNRDGMTYEQAVEYLDFNTLGAYVGENGPIYLHPRKQP